MNYLLWAQFIANLANTIAQANGAAPREMLYLGMLTRATTLASMTESDLAELKQKYENEVANNVETSVDELYDLVDRIQARGERIQGA